MSYADRIAKYPQVEGRCFACGGQTLFVGEGGYITCSYLSCPNPSAVNQVLLNKLPAGEEWCACCGLRFAVTEGECDQCWQTANDAKWTERGNQWRSAFARLAIPTQALLLDKGSHKYISPEIISEWETGLRDGLGISRLKKATDTQS